jgi:hypothetical protein
MATKKAKKKAIARGKKAASKRSPRKAARKPAPRAKAPQVNAVVHWEIQSQDPARLHKFYAEALGWKIDTNNPMQYGMVDSKGRDGIGGGIGGSQGSGSRVLVYASVASIPAALERIESLGGKTLMPRSDIGPVIMALYQDPEGNVMGLLEG